MSKLLISPRYKYCKAVPSQNILHSKFVYDPETGIITRKCRGKNKVGTVVKGYLELRINGKRYGAHRIAWALYYKKDPVVEIDHINRNGLDNRIDNLRLVTTQENQRNRRISKNNRSGVDGVYWCNTKNKWRAQIKISGVNKHIGIFKNKEDAVKARRKYEEENNFYDM